MGVTGGGGGMPIILMSSSLQNTKLQAVSR